MFLPALATLAGATAGSDGMSGVPTCFPLFASITVLVNEVRLDGHPVFVEESSACVGHTPLAPTRVPVPAGITGRAALEHVVQATASSVAHVARYEVVDRAGGWLVAPIGDRLMDLPVDLDASKWPTVGAARITLFGQVALARRIWIPPGPKPFGAYNPVEDGVNPGSFTDRPLLEALQAVYGPHEASPPGFAMLIDTAAMGGLGRQQARFEVLRTPVER